MFKKFSSLPDPKERLEIFNLLRFNLALCRRLAEFLTLTTLIVGFGWLTGRQAAPIPPLTYSAPLIGLALFFAVLPRWLFLTIESSLAADFGLDPRPAGQRLTALAAWEIRWLPAAWLLSVLMFHLLTILELWVWALAVLVVGAGVFLLDAFKLRLLRPERLRLPLEGEVPPALGQRLDKWARQLCFKPWAIRVDTTPSPYLAPPRLSGLGPAQTLVIPENALGAFVPRALNLLTVSAVMEGLVKAPLKILFLRGCALAVVAPLAAVFIKTLGPRLWLYPLIYNPALIILVWLAGWLGLTLANFSARIVRRDLEVQLAAAAALILKDDEAVGSARTTLAVKNLEEDDPPAWRDWFSDRYSRPVFMKRFQHYRSLNANAIPHPPKDA
jgi:hypothetical protein